MAYLGVSWARNRYDGSPISPFHSSISLAREKHSMYSASSDARISRKMNSGNVTVDAALSQHLEHIEICIYIALPLAHTIAETQRWRRS